jgi:hypothetical protein
MTEKLETVLEKVSTISNPINSSLIQEFYQFMVDNRNSDSYKKNNLKTLMLFSIMNLLLMSPFTIFRKKERYLNFKIRE